MLVKISKRRQNTRLKRKEETKYNRKEEKGGKKCLLEGSEILDKVFFSCLAIKVKLRILKFTEVLKHT